MTFGIRSGKLIFSLDRFQKLLGSGPEAGTVVVTVFVPSVDRDGISVDQTFWRTETLQVLGTLFRGATAFPPSEGGITDFTDEGG